MKKVKSLFQSYLGSRLKSRLSEIDCICIWFFCYFLYSCVFKVFVFSTSGKIKHWLATISHQKNCCSSCNLFYFIWMWKYKLLTTCFALKYLPLRHSKSNSYKGHYNSQKYGHCDANYVADHKDFNQLSTIR